MDFNQFAQYICDYLNDSQKSICDLNSKDCSEYGCWGIISRYMNGKYDKLQALKLFTAWKRKNYNIRTIVTNKMKDSMYLI